jgi:hypothetical protein
LLSTVNDGNYNKILESRINVFNISLNFVRHFHRLTNVTMEREKSISLIEKQIMSIDALKNEEISAPLFKKWHRDTQIVLEKIFW